MSQMRKYHWFKFRSIPTLTPFILPLFWQEGIVKGCFSSPFEGEG